MFWVCGTWYGGIHGRITCPPTFQHVRGVRHEEQLEAILQGVLNGEVTALKGVGPVPPCFRCVVRVRAVRVSQICHGHRFLFVRPLPLSVPVVGVHDLVVAVRVGVVLHWGVPRLQEALGDVAVRVSDREQLPQDLHVVSGVKGVRGGWL